MSSSDSSFSVVQVSICCKWEWFAQRLTLLLLLLLLLGGGGLASGGGSAGGGSRATGADVGQELLDVLALEGLGGKYRQSLVFFFWWHVAKPTAPARDVRKAQ